MAFLAPAQVAHYAYEAGFRGRALVTAVAIAKAESTFNTAAVNPNDTCYGLWQVSTIHDKPPLALMNPSFNAKMAYQISEGGRNWDPWTTYMNGAYKHYWSIAETAARAIGQASIPSYPHLNVRVDNSPYPAIADKAVTYLNWFILKKWGIPYKYFGNGKFSIEGQTVQGIVYDGNSYVAWGSIPGIKVTRVNGEFNFTDGNQMRAAM
ncbi:transglycosylase SLT domain-containing protein [Alicyclobacillus sp. ALC3]|uniref:transglycosylase SLT domain-containing protein n=1 Tax=Alicyclobacillus sp. ALC3 TaxID=2796143 RepID=UPI002379DFDF|nr:transglycosylase SLT domain-containing protein [Alicyclobacillus sp. ALC3]WDL95714.1 transglycosylase SLT domain-containing protein [Alicyclobacillus sp. ALC3]